MQPKQNAMIQKQVNYFLDLHFMHTLIYIVLIEYKISDFTLSILDKRMNYKKVTCCETDNCNGARSSPNLFAGMHGSQGVVSTIQTIIFSSCFAIMFSQANILQGRFSLATNDVF